MYNIITNLLVLLQVQQKIISILFLLVTAKPLKSKSSDKPANVPYRKLVIDQMPIFDTHKVFYDNIPKSLDYTQLLNDYFSNTGKILKPVKRRSISTTSVPESLCCPICGAPHQYLYVNNGGKGQYQCKVCNSLFNRQQHFVKEPIFRCPHCGHRLDKIKERITELIVQLSRFSIEGGAEISQIFSLNHNYLKEVERFENIEQLSVWLSSVMNEYFSYVFELQDVKHADSIYKAERFIKENYMQKISLNDVAGHVYLSKAYLSKIFKEETGISLVNYINRLRIDKSKTLLKDHSLSLADIAALVGFDDQSYFSKIFKGITGVSPGKYRKNPSK